MLVAYCPDPDNCLPCESQAIDIVVGAVNHRVHELAHGVPLHCLMADHRRVAASPTSCSCAWLIC